jgi:hypothetical protein
MVPCLQEHRWGYMDIELCFQLQITALANATVCGSFASLPIVTSRAGLARTLAHDLDPLLSKEDRPQPWQCGRRHPPANFLGGLRNMRRLCAQLRASLRP